MSDALSHLTGKIPLVLLPARIETRWDVTDAASPVLMIRVYPDEINASGHQEGLSEDEISAGEQWWAAGADKPEAWRLLQQAVGAPRAAWIVRVFNEARKTNNTATITPRASVRPAFATALPARWIAVGYAAMGVSHLRVFEVASADIRGDALQLSPTRAPTETEGLVEPAMAWLTDFKEALGCGMGLEIRKTDLNPQSWWKDLVCKNGLSRLLVIGVPRSSSHGVTDHVAALRALLEKHHYSSGLAVVPPGTPTNNTSSAVSGYSSSLDVLGPFDHERNLGDSGSRGRSDAIQPCAGGVNRPVAERRWTTGGARALEGLGLLPPAPADPTAKAPAGRWTPLSNLAAQSPPSLGLSPAEAMRVLLFPGLLGRALREDYTVPVEDIADVWLHFARDVAPEGHWPTLRRGKVPYAVMPVSAIPTSNPSDPWKASDAERPSGIDSVLQKLWPKVRQASASLSSVSDENSVGDKNAGLSTLGRVLSQGAFSHGLAGLKGTSTVPRDIGARTLRILQDSLTGNIAGQSWANLVEARYAQWCGVADTDPLCAWSGTCTGYNDDNLSWKYAREQAFSSFYAQFRALVDGKKDTEKSNGVHALNRWCLAFLLDHALTDTLKNATTVGPSIDLVTALVGADWFKCTVQRLLLTENAEGPSGGQNPLTAEDQLQADGSSSNVDVRVLSYLRSKLSSAPDLVLFYDVAEFGRITAFQPSVLSDLTPAHGLLSWFAVLTLQSLLEIAALLVMKIENNRIHVESYGDDLWQLWKHAMEVLGDPLRVSREQRERLMLQTIDACSHRLDPWLTALAHRRLERLDIAASGADNRYLGAYAWVHNVPEAPAKQQTQGGAGGFVLAPSLNAAMAAAVLRNPILDPDNAGEPLFVDLDAGRARLARALLMGVRNGVPLPALLGQRLERDLADRDLEVWIAPLRRAFPLDPPEEEEEDQDLSPVVDGLALARFWRERTATSGWGSTELTTQVGARPPEGLKNALNALVGALDAVSDLMVAEGIYQAVLGNTDRAAAALAAMDGEGDAPVPQILDSPRSGSPLGFQVLLSLGASEDAPAGWPATLTPRAVAEPVLNRWLGERLADLSVPNPHRLHPIDVLALVQKAKTAGSTDALAAALGADAALAMEILDRLLPVAELLETARPAGRDDLRSTGVVTSDPAVPDDPAIPEDRVSALYKRMPTAPGAADALQWGLKGQDAAAWRQELQTRLKAYTEAKPVENADAPALERAHLAQIQALLGEGAIVVPGYSLNNTSAMRPVVVAETDSSVWLGQAARCHESLERWWLWRLGDPGSGATVLQTALGGDSPAVQAGYDPARWIGLGVKAADDTHRDDIVKGLAGTQSLIVDGPWPKTGEKLYALRVDGWTERIPLAKATTGVSFHYDDAGAEAPQAILVAVPPDPTRPTWALDHLERVLMDTLDLARARGVTPDELAGLGQLVPPLTLTEERFASLSPSSGTTIPGGTP